MCVTKILHIKIQWISGLHIEQAGVAFVILWAVFSAGKGWAQTAPAVFSAQTGKGIVTKTVAQDKEIPVKEQLTSAQDRLSTAKTEMAAPLRRGELPAGASQNEAEEYEALRERLVRLYEQQVKALEQRLTITAGSEELQRQADAWTEFAVPPPYPLKLSDGLWREIGNKDREILSLQVLLNFFENELENAKKLLAERAPDVQQSAERLNTAKPGKDAARLRWLLELNKLRTRIAEVEVAEKETERRVVLARIAAKQGERAFLTKKLDKADMFIQFSKQEMDDLVDNLDREQLELRKEIGRNESDNQTIYKELSQARERLNQLRQQISKQPDDASTTAEDIRLSEQFVNLLAVREETATMQMRALLQTSWLIDRIRAVWKQRFALLNSPGDRTIVVDLETLQTEQVQFEQLRNALISLQASIQQKLMDEQARQSDSGTDAAARGQHLELAGLYRRQAAALEPLLARMAQFGDLLERTGEEAEHRKQILSFLERLKNMAVWTREATGKLADFEIYSVTDTLIVEGEEITGTRRVTLGEIALFLIIITAGFWLVACAVRFGQKVVKHLFGVSTDSATLFARLAHIVLSLIVVAVALTTMKIPLAVFAFLGGALALAIGFGAQNLLNNFVSGLMLLIERPVKIDDIVDVEGVTGRITQIGTRCCQIRRMDGIEMLVPNSAMIEKTVTNWTLSDKKRRSSVSISIDYGSPVEQTQSLIETVVREHGDVLLDPAPLVLLEDFSERALAFTVYYWLDLAQVADRLVVASEIRVTLIRRLSEAGIAIAHPQRDVYIHSDRPLEVAVRL